MMDSIRVTNAEYVRDHVLKLTFSDGRKADVDFMPWIEKFPLFEPLTDRTYFQDFSLDSWTVVWPNGADIAPEALYAAAAKELERQAA